MADSFWAREAVPQSISDAVLEALGAVDREARNQAVERAARIADPDELVNAVADQGNSARRNAAIEALRKSGARSVPALVRALKHEDPEVVMFAASILGKSRDTTVIPDLIKLLSHQDVNIVASAIESLGHLRATEALGPLLGMLKRDPWLQFATVHALGEIGDPRGTEPLSPLLEDDAMREIVVQALGKIGTHGALAKLAVVLQTTEDMRTFSACVRAVGAALARLHDEQQLTSIEAWKQLGTHQAADAHARLLRIFSEDRPAVETKEEQREVKAATAAIVQSLHLKALYTPLVLAGQDSALREVLQFFAISIGEDIADALRVGISYSSDSVRLLACHCAGALRLRELTPGVALLLESPHPGVRAEAARTLARLAPDTMATQVAKLLRDEEPSVRAASVEALSQMHAQSVADALAPLRRSSSKESPALLSCVLAVARANPHAGHRDLVLECLDRGDATVRRDAVAALGTQPDADIVAYLAPLLRDPSVDVRRQVITELAKAPLVHVRTLLNEQMQSDPDTLDQLVQVLSFLGDTSLAPQLIDLFPNASRAAQLAILEALPQLQEPTAQPLIVRQLASSDAEIRCYAVRALSRIGTQTAMRHVVHAARDPDRNVRAMVVRVLADACEAPKALNDERVVEELDRLSVDEDEAIAHAARSILERWGRG